MRNGNKLAKYVVSIAVSLLLIPLPLIIKDAYILHVVIQMGIAVTLAVSLSLVLTVGQFSIGHAAFMGVGAYTSSILVMKLGVSFWAALPLAGVAAVIVAIPIGYTTLRIKGVYFAVTTLAFCELVMIMIGNLECLGGWEGIHRIPAPNSVAIPGLPIVDFLSKTPFYYLMLVITTVTVWAVYSFQKSHIGIIFKAIRQNDTLAESMKINILKYKLLAFGIACFFAGVGGSFYAHYFQYICPESFDVWHSIYYLIYCVLGGLESVFGPAIGGILLTVFPEFLRASRELATLIFACTMIAVIFLLPEGLVSMRRFIPMWFSRLRKRVSC
jgi:branched-chain amino acid transport system permease protein